MSTTVPVEYRVTGIERVRRGHLVALAIVEVEIAGVVIQLQGVQVHNDGGVVCRAPMWRHPRDGRWLPAIILPRALSEALAAEVLAEAGPVLA